MKTWPAQRLLFVGGLTADNLIKKSQKNSGPKAAIS
jgi:hypothetical protein